MWERRFVVWEETDDDGDGSQSQRSQVQFFATDSMILRSRPAKLSSYHCRGRKKTFSFFFLLCRPKCGVVVLQEQPAGDVRHALEGSASFVLDEDLCPSTRDRGRSRPHHEVPNINAHGSTE